jgi:protein-tyrosine phosphatase
VDANDPSFFAKEMIDKALDFIDENLSNGKKVLIHCNQGESRSPSIALVYLASRTDVLPRDSLEEAEIKFRSFYPLYDPKPGLREHIRQNWRQYCSKQ